LYFCRWTKYTSWSHVFEWNFVKRLQDYLRKYAHWQFKRHEKHFDSIICNL
jgi:hypothetical protein